MCCNLFELVYAVPLSFSDFELDFHPSYYLGTKSQTFYFGNMDLDVQAKYILKPNLVLVLSFLRITILSIRYFRFSSIIVCQP